MKIYRTLIRPVVTYGRVAWTLKKLEQETIKKFEKKLFWGVIKTQLKDNIYMRRQPGNRRVTKTRRYRMCKNSRNTVTRPLGTHWWAAYLKKNREGTCI